MNGVPVAMFSPPLAKLQHNIENLDALKPTNAEIQFAIRFWMCAIKLYNTEEEREQHI